MDFSIPENNQYEFRLLPVDTSWQKIQGEPILNYYNLSPEKYRLELRGSNSKGIWTKEPTVMNIHISPPWWKTWWAYLLYVVTIIGAILWYIRNLNQRLAKEQAHNKELTNLNTLHSRV